MNSQINLMLQEVWPLMSEKGRDKIYHSVRWRLLGDRTLEQAEEAGEVEKACNVLLSYLEGDYI